MSFNTAWPVACFVIAGIFLLAAREQWKVTGPGGDETQLIALEKPEVKFTLVAGAERYASPLMTQLFYTVEVRAAAAAAGAGKNNVPPADTKLNTP
jgi:hypothetical protein